MKTVSSFLIRLLAIGLVACGGNPSTENEVEVNEDKKAIELFGNTQGTTFTILCNDPVTVSLEEVSAVLHDFDMSLSGYEPESVLSRLNNASAGSFQFQDEDNYFNRCYQITMDVFEWTDGALDPTVYPLVDGWGFMKNIENVPDSATVDSLRALVGFQNGYHFTYTAPDSLDTAYTILKRTPNAKLDFNAIAQGLAVDVLAELLESKGAKNYFVEIGGEIRVKGHNSEGRVWRIGIDKPVENSTAESRELQEIVEVNNKSIATSGSYRKFYEKNGVKYAHTLDPKTGYPVTHSLLSATVVADNCALADALATAFMIMGVDKTKIFLDEHPELDVEVYLIYANKKAETEIFYTNGFGQMILN